MSERNLWLNPGETESLERKRFEKWRACGKWMNRRTYIVHKTGQGQFGRARAAANGRVGFQHEYRTSSLGEGDRASQSVRSGSNNDCVVVKRHIEYRRKSRLVERLDRDRAPARRMVSKRPLETLSRSASASFYFNYSSMPLWASGIRTQLKRADAAKFAIQII